jgi:hypothetical protein
MASRTASKDIITLRGSAAIVSEFFGTRRRRPPRPYPESSSPLPPPGGCLTECFSWHRRLRGE